MKNLLNPRWLLVINIIPVIILCLLYSSEYNVIKSLLEEDNIQLWFNFGGTLCALTVLLIGYMVFSIQTKKDISLQYALVALIIYTAFLYTYSVYSNDIMPRNIPRWMLSNESILYPGTFLMPTLVHALFVIVLKLTSKAKEHKAWKSFLLALSIPLISYIFFQAILPLWKPVSYRYREHVLTIFCVIVVVVFLFFVIRGIYILSLKKGTTRKELYLITKVLIGVLFPILGLSVNAGFNDVFGDFNSVWFYIIAILNGILLCISALKNERYRFILFITRCITFAFTFYFFLVFLPYLPLSVIMILAVGTGFLMLTPLVLFVIHAQELSKDFKYLSAFYKKNVLYTILIIGFLVLPSIITINYAHHKTILNNTLDFVYTPDYEKEYNINTSSLERTLNVIKSTKKRRIGWFSSSQTPFLSSYFHWLVLDNLTLSDAKINTIENIFFKTKPFSLTPERLRNNDVEISNISSNSSYSEKDKSWTSWIDIEITNANTSNFTSEYATTINLPHGCWINDYYLYVGDRKEMGLLTEKKSALWIFSEIRNINRDPGLLHYKTGNNVSFRVFPFAKNEVRKTGIQFIHKDPVSIDIDGHKLSLGKTIETSKKESNNGAVVYVSAEEKSKLKTIKRTPYFHFIVDTSKEKDILKENYIETINNFISKNKKGIKNTRISFTNAFTNTFKLSEDWNLNLNNQIFEGGFYLERGIKKILFNSYTKCSDNYPIIVVVTDNMLDAIVEKNFADFKVAFPESDTFYHLNTLERLASHSLTSTPKTFVNDSALIHFEHEVLPWPNAIKPLAYLPNNELPSIALKKSTFEFDDTTQTSGWDTGLQLHGKWLSDVFYPKHADKDWVTSVQRSFKSRIMTPLTSYIVVETEAQKAALLRKQEQALNGKRALDLNERAQRMSEPGLVSIILLFAVFLFMKYKRKISYSTPST